MLQLKAEKYSFTFWLLEATSPSEWTPTNLVCCSLCEIAVQPICCEVFFFLQRKDGEDAKSLTSEEFQDVMQKMQEKANTIKLSSRFSRAYYCFDNDAIHKGAVLDKKVMDNNLELPPHSPDLNKPVEHAFNTIKDRWREMLLLDSKILEPQEYMDRLQHIYS